MIIVIGAVAGGGSSSTPNSNTQEVKKESSNTETEKEVAKEPEEISVQELADDFDGNQVAAESKWGGKFVKFSAEISNITDTGISFTDVATKDFSMTQISCKIKDKNQLMPLKNGETVTVKGVIGDQMIGVIELKECEVVN